jgi:predicted cupin superfamily sugar epimerase
MTTTQDPNARAWIERLHLEPHPEGGWYREIHRSPVTVRRESDSQRRSGLTLIHYLLEAGAVSRWHRVRGADEVWQHTSGAPLLLWRLPPDGGVAEELRLGPLGTQEPEQMPVQIIPAGWWQAARSQGAWSLVSCCVGPGFEFADFELLRQRPAEQDPPGALSVLR